MVREPLQAQAPALQASLKEPSRPSEVPKSCTAPHLVTGSKGWGHLVTQAPLPGLRWGIWRGSESDSKPFGRDGSPHSFPAAHSARELVWNLFKNSWYFYSKFFKPDIFFQVLFF